MAACILLQQSAFPPAIQAAGTYYNGTLTMPPVAWSFANATLVNGKYTCSIGTHILLTTEESTAEFGMTAQDGLTVGWSVAAIWLGVWAMMFIARIVRDGAKNDSNES
jgi:hypothetical protein